MDLIPGTVLASRYRVLGAVAHGATGTVYRARDTLLGQTVALKVLRDELAARPARARRFRREAELARRVSHPGVCRVHEYVEDGPWRFLVMELVKGGTLKRRIGRGALPSDRAYDIALQVAEALAAVHAAGMVHRHLTARNVLHGKGGRVKLTDFGLARSVRSCARPAGRARGTPEYMSPEQARGEAVDVRSDVYSLGVLLFEMLTGTLPFRGSTPVVTRYKQMYDPPPLAGPQSARLPLRLLPVLAKALAKKPEDRYPSTVEMAHALRAARAASDVMAMDAGSTVWGLGGTELDLRPVPSTVRVARRVLPSLLAMAALVAIAATGVRWLVHPRPALDPMARGVETKPAVPVVESKPAAPATEARPVTPSSPPAPAPAARKRPPAAPAGQKTAESLTATVEPAALSSSPAVVSAAPPLPAPVVPVPTATRADGPAATAAEGPGRLQIGVRPWAAVSLDGRSIGATPLAPLALPPGVYTARLEHPNYRPIVRKVIIHPGETVRLRVDMSQDGIPR